MWTIFVNSGKVSGSKYRPQAFAAGATIKGERRSKSSRMHLSEVMTIVIAFDGSGTNVQRVIHPTGIPGMA